MIKSVLMRRFFAAVLTAILLVAAITWLAFSAMSDSVFIRLRAADMMPRARSFAELAARYMRNEIGEDVLMIMVNADDRQNSPMSTYAVIADADGNVIFTSESGKMRGISDLSNEISEALGGSSFIHSVRGKYGEKRLIIGMPILDEGRRIGALILYTTDIQSAVSMSIISSALALSVGIALPIVLIMLYYMLYRLVRPLKRMSDAALSMAKGNFKVRADANLSGEIGLLGSSLNVLAQELQKSISALVLERNRLVQLLDSLSEGIIAVDSNGAITHKNRSLAELLKGSPDMGERLSAVPFKEIWDAFDSVCKDGNPYDETFKYCEKDIRCIIRAVYDEGGKPAGAVGIFRDISSEMHLERTRREYVANVSHEMRTPLTTLRALIEPLRDGMIKDEAARQRYYDIILRETMRLSRLINDIMELSRLQSGTTSIENSVFDPKDTVYYLAERYSAIAQEKGLELVLEKGMDSLPKVRSNPDRLEQILVILIDNAIKYTKAGRVTVAADVTDEKVIFRVSDTGTGISAENLPYIFERFYKVDKAHSEKGSGLGLAIAKEVLTAMGETVSVRSEEGKGTEFAFTISRA